MAKNTNTSKVNAAPKASKAPKSSVVDKQVIESHYGKFATVVVSQEILDVPAKQTTRLGQTVVDITFKKSGKKLSVKAGSVDLKTMKSEGNLNAAMAKVAHAGLGVALFTSVTMHSARGVFRGKLNKKNNTGYGTFLAKGKKPLSFDLTRIDLDKMKAASPEAAIRKAMFGPRGGFALTTEELQTANA